LVVGKTIKPNHLCLGRDQRFIGHFGLIVLDLKTHPWAHIFWIKFRGSMESKSFHHQQRDIGFEGRHSQLSYGGRMVSRNIVRLRSTLV
jgi:hypothetical protein